MYPPSRVVPRGSSRPIQSMTWPSRSELLYFSYHPLTKCVYGSNIIASSGHDKCIRIWEVGTKDPAGMGLIQSSMWSKSIINVVLSKHH